MTSSLDIQQYQNQLRRIIFHLRLRYIGFPLLVCGILILCTVFLQNHLAWYWNIASIMSCGLSLASFGSNHDTAIAYAAVLPHQKLKTFIQTESNHIEPQVRKSLFYILTELEDEKSWKNTTIDSLEPHPYIASIIPIVTIALQILIFQQL